jgi:biopolymer transport protein ExbD
MINFEPSPHIKRRPEIDMTSMIDIMFINLLFFMALFVYFHFETELNISVPKASASVESRAASQEIIVNIGKGGEVVVGQKHMDLSALSALLKRTAALYPQQAVIIRADQKTYHEHVIQVLDVCAKANIWNISFATTKEQ